MYRFTDVEYSTGVQVHRYTIQYRCLGVQMYSTEFEVQASRYHLRRVRPVVRMTNQRLAVAVLAEGESNQTKPQSETTTRWESPVRRLELGDTPVQYSDVDTGAGGWSGGSSQRRS